MIRISSPEELLSTFRSIDRDEVQIPSNMTFPMTFRDYLKWLEPSGARVYLVFPSSSGKLLGVSFRRTPGSREAAPAMCQWCHSVRPGDAVGLLTASIARNHRVGVHLCTDLDCREKALSAPSINDFYEGLNGTERIQRIVQRMDEFAKRNLF